MFAPILGMDNTLVSFLRVFMCVYICMYAYLFVCLFVRIGLQYRTLFDSVSERRAHICHCSVQSSVIVLNGWR